MPALQMAFGAVDRKQAVPILGNLLLEATRGKVEVWGTDLEIEVGAPMAEPSDLDVFLSARFGLHTRIGGRTRYVPNEHPPWPLHHARVLAIDFVENRVAHHILFTAPPDLFEKYEPVLLEVLNTYQPGSSGAPSS